MPSATRARSQPYEPFAVFVRLGKAGSDLEADAEALGRLISLILRLSSPTSRVARVQEIIGQLEMIGGAHSILRTALTVCKAQAMSVQAC